MFKEVAKQSIYDFGLSFCDKGNPGTHLRIEASNK